LLPDDLDTKLNLMDGGHGSFRLSLPNFGERLSLKKIKHFRDKMIFGRGTGDRRALTEVNVRLISA